MEVRRILEIDRRFFEKYQRQLLFIANTRIGRWYFRLGEHPAKVRFTRFFPFAVEWANEDGTITGAFKTSDKYANRLKYSLRHLKAFLLAIGLGAVARGERIVALQFLFAGVVTDFRPDPNPESTTVDGYAQHGGGSVAWSTLRGSSGNFSEDDGTDYTFAYWSAAGTLNEWDTIARGIFLFDTTIIDTGSTVSAGSFIFYCPGKTAPADTDVTKRELRLASSAPASNTALTGTDYATLGNTSLGALAYSSITASASNTITLNASGLTNVTKGGISKFGTRSGADQDDTAPTWAGSDQYIVYGRFADYTGTSDDPTLRLTYSAVLSVSETVSMTETQQKQPGRTLAETIGSTDSQSSLLVKQTTASETQATSDALGSKSIGRTVGESVALTDVSLKSFARALLETVVSADSVATSFVAVRAFLETVTVLDVVFFWRPRIRPATSWMDRSAPGGSWTDRTPPSTSWSDRSAPGGSWSDRTPPTTPWS